MNASELRARSVEELNSELIDLLKEQFNMRMQKGAGQLTHTHHVRRVRRDIARVKTLLGEQNSAGENA